MTGFDTLYLVGGAAAVVAAALTSVWLVVMVTVPDPEAGAASELAFVAEHPKLQIARFLPTTLVAFAYVPVWVALAAVLWETNPAWSLLAAGFGVAYPPLCATGYWLQYTTVRALADVGASRPQEAAICYEIVGFHDRQTSVAGSVVVLGYVFWSCGGLAAAFGLLEMGGGWEVTAGILFLLTAVLMVIGAAGMIIRSKTLSLGVFASGAVSLLATIAVAVVLLGQT